MAKMSSMNAQGPGRPDWLPRSAYPFQIRFADAGGAMIHYIDEGSGPALLMVSAGQWSMIFRDVIMRLRQEFRCLALDFPGCGLSPDAPGHDHGVLAGARVLEAFIDAIDLQDITMLVHDLGGPIGFLAATRRPGRFRALVVSNTFGWPLARYPAVRRVLRVVGSWPFGAVNNLTNVLARLTASPYGAGRVMSKADRNAFLGPWRRIGSRRATQQTLAGALRIDSVMAEVEQSLRTSLADLPVLTLFGRKNDPYDWQTRFGQMFPQATAVVIPDGHHFPFADDPDAYAATVRTWWARSVANPDKNTDSTRSRSK